MPTLHAIDLVGDDRERAVPIVIDSFVGIYRWHAKRTLRRVSAARGALDADRLVGVSMLEDLAPGVGYVYYVAVLRDYRKHKVGTFLLDDALTRFRNQRCEIVYAAAEEDNEASRALFTSRGFRLIDRDELGYREGGLGAWGLRSKMMVVSGEILMGLRLNPPGTSVEPSPGRLGPGAPTGPAPRAPG
ncbi:MAG: GNAT family N-acetyltransferase [Thermoplasmata archaeon]